MYSALKRTAAVTIILAVVNAISAVLTYMIISPMGLLDITGLTTLIGLLATTSLTFLVLGITLWHLHGDLEAHMDATYSDITALRKRVEDLEKNK